MDVNSNAEMLFSTRSEWQLRDATIEKLLGEVFSMRPVPRLYNEEQIRLWECRVLRPQLEE
jgi:hypothetical protein